MKRACILGAVLSASLAFQTLAQEPQPAAGDDPADATATDASPKKPAVKGGASKPGDKPAAPAAPQNVLPPITGGDKITMVSGSIMTGVQVVKSTPKFYEIQMVEGQPTIQIPRRQVQSVEYDDIDPGRERLRQELFPEAKEVTIASGEKVTGELRDKLMAPVSDEAVSYKDTDFIKVLEDVKTKTGATLTVDQSIADKPAAQRRWTIEVPADKTLMTLLREDLVGAFKFVEVVFESDSIIVMTKDAAKARAAEKVKSAPADGGAPADEADAKPAGDADSAAAAGTTPAGGNAADILKSIQKKPKAE